MNKNEIIESIKYIYKNNLFKKVNELNIKIKNIYISCYMIYKNIELNDINIIKYEYIAKENKIKQNEILEYNRKILNNELNNKITVPYKKIEYINK